MYPLNQHRTHPSALTSKGDHLKLPRPLLLLLCCFLPFQQLRADTQSFSNSTFITIPDSGAATPYPSNVTVNGMAGTITDVSVTLNNFTHSWSSDVDVLLVSPTGQKVVIFSD